MLVSELLTIRGVKPASETDAVPRPVPLRIYSEPGAEQPCDGIVGVVPIQFSVAPDDVFTRNRDPSPVKENVLTVARQDCLMYAARNVGQLHRRQCGRGLHWRVI